MNTKKLTGIVLLLFFILASSTILFGQSTIWEEDFTYPDGTSSGSGGKWTVDISDCSFDGDDHFEVRDNRLEGNDLDGEAIWTSEVIDISTYSNVSVTLLGNGEGGLEGSDYLKSYYILDGGPETLFSSNGELKDDFGTATAGQSGLNGNSLVIIVKIKNNANTEFIRFDDVLVQGFAGPEIDVSGNGQSIPNGDMTPTTADDTDFGSVEVGSQSGTHFFRIDNTGNEDLILDGSPRIAIEGTHPGDFSVTVMPAGPIPGSDFVECSIRFIPTAEGLRTATVRIENNDLDEDPYTFAIQGTGTTPPGNPGDPSDGGIEPVYVPGNPDCGDMDQLCECTSSFKPSGNGIGTFTYPDGVSEVTATASSGTHFDWASDLAVCCVIVKGGNNANVYHYDPPSYGDGSLHPPINPNNNQPYGISHIEYCYTPDSQQKASISDYVWEDLNGNGIQDDGQSGVANVIVELYTCGGTSPVSTTTTDGNGWYEFAGLIPGDYFLRVIPPPSYYVTAKDQGSDDALDSDVDPATLQTVCTNLDPGENDVTWDVGLYRKGTIRIEKQTIPDGTPDSFIFNGGDLGTFTLTDGQYSIFSDLNPGTYNVAESLPPGWGLTSIVFDPTNSGSSNQETATIELQSNQTVTVTFTNSIQKVGTFIEAEKTANAEFQRSWEWTIDKVAYPTEWHIFEKDIVETAYKVTVEKVEFSDVISLSGQVCVRNHGNLPTTDLTVFDHAQYKTPSMNDWEDIPGASVTITPAQIPVGAQECYNYSFTFDAIEGADYRNVALVTITNYSGFIGVPYGREIIEDFDLPATPTTEINGTIHVEDTNGQTWETDQSAEWTYEVTYDGYHNSGLNVNTATITETQQQADASVMINSYQLEVVKTASTSFDRNYLWTIDKIADISETELSVCDELQANYTVRLNAEYVDTNYQVTGAITITNPSPNDIEIIELTDELPGSQQLVLDCSVEFPYILPANSSMECTYHALMVNDESRTNTAHVTSRKYRYSAEFGKPIVKTSVGIFEILGRRSVLFSSDPTNIIDESVEVNDTNLDPMLLGTVAAADAPKEFTYSKIIGPYDTAGDYLIENITSFITNDTQTTGEDSWAVAVNVPCEDPYAEFEGAPLEGFSCLTVEFHSETSCDVVEWFWDFGDGGTSTEEHPTHTYCPPVDPKFHVSLTVTNTCGRTTTVLKRNYITVYIHVTADFDAEPTVGYGPLSVQFQNKSTGMIDDYLWDFGDGTTSTGHSPVHCYSEPGIYTVTLTASGPLESETKEITQLIQVYDDVAAAGKLSLVLIEGSDCWNEYEDWNNAIDGDTYGWTGTTNAGESDPWAIFMAADGMTHNINKVRMMTDTRVPEKQNDWVTRFEVLVSTTGTAAGDFTSVGEFNNTSGDWNEFTLNPVAAKYVKLNVIEPSNKWRQVGEFEVYEHIELPDIAGSVLTATTPQIASGLDTCTVTVKLADENGNAVSGIEPSAFRIVAEGCGNTCGQVAETVPGTYVGSFTSVVPGDKQVVVWVYDHKVEFSEIASETPVIVSFLEPTYELAALQLVAGTDCYDGEGWENAYDGDIEGADAMVSAGPKWGDSHAIFEFADQTTKTIHKYRMITDVGIGWEAHWLTHYQLWVSTTGTADDDFVMIHDHNRTSGDWEEFVIQPVDVKYLKLVLLQPAGNWKQIGELEMFTVPVAISLNKTAQTLTAKSLVNLPTKYALQQNYPNPFNPETTIEYHLPQASDVKISIYNIRGQLVQMLENGYKKAGVHHAIWNSVDAAGTDVVSGIYFYRIQATGEDGTKYSFTRRMVLLK